MQGFQGPNAYAICHIQKFQLVTRNGRILAEYGNTLQDGKYGGIFCPPDL